ncbi:MAG: geranylgeranyl reductase family protein, partial [Anaerolineae bacterium]|nr:geranylgeranyl reductase family protein [Anaerolineae bacterium]
MTSQRESAEVVIVGAGPAGSTLAALLAARGHDVLLLDRALFPRDKTCGDGLTPRAVGVLERLGLLEGLRANGYRQIHGALLHAPGGDRWHMRFADYDLGLPAFGLVIPRVELDDHLRRHAIQCGARFRGGADVLRPLYRETAVSGRRIVGGVEARTTDGLFQVQARLTVIAAGAAIGLLRAFGVLRAMPPGIHAMRGYYDRVPDLTDAFEFYFDPELSPGYGWVFPTGDGRANIGIGILDRGKGGPAPNLRAQLDAFLRRHERLAAATPIGPIKGYPIRIDFPRCRPIGDGFLVIGEAAGLVNPVTGEGIDLAMESAELAAEAITAALAAGDVTVVGLRGYAHDLHARYSAFFRGIRVLLRLATGPRALNILIRKAPQRPALARAIAGINLGVASPLS